MCVCVCDSYPRVYMYHWQRHDADHRGGFSTIRLRTSLPSPKQLQLQMAQSCARALRALETAAWLVTTSGPRYPAPPAQRSRDLV